MGKRHTVQDIDDLIDNFHAHRKAMRAAGKIDDFGHPVPPPAPAKAEEKKAPHTHDSFCLKCKNKVQSLTDKVEPTDRGTHKATGKCAVCGTKTSRLLNNKDGQAMLSDMASTGGTA